MKNKNNNDEKKLIAILNRMSETRYLNSIKCEVDKDYTISVEQKKYGRIMHDGSIKTIAGERESLIDFLDSHYRNTRSAITNHIIKTLGIRKEEL